MSELLQHWFISDLHLGHRNVIRFDNRPFDSIEQHDAALTANCRRAGGRNRTLWLLGDVATRASDLTSFMTKVLPAWDRVILIRGNHDDRAAWKHRDLFAEAHESRYLRVTNDVRVYMSHYAHRTWRNSHHGAYHIHGHSHGNLPRWGRSLDVGANCPGVDYHPVSLQWVVDELRDSPLTPHHPTVD